MTTIARQQTGPQRVELPIGATSAEIPASKSGAIAGVHVPPGFTGGLAWTFEAHDGDSWKALNSDEGDQPLAMTVTADKSYPTLPARIPGAFSRVRVVFTAVATTATYLVFEMKG